jgi:hypothetical protein
MRLKGLFSLLPISYYGPGGGLAAFVLLLVVIVSAFILLLLVCLIRVLRRRSLFGAVLLACALIVSLFVLREMLPPLGFSYLRWPAHFWLFYLALLLTIVWYIGYKFERLREREKRSSR